MLGDYRNAKKIALICGTTDMRKGISGLAALVKTAYGMEPCDNTLFLFCGRNRSVLKALYYERDGFLLLTKSLREGRFKWPRNQGEVLMMNRQALRWLLEGLSPVQKSAISQSGERVDV